MMFWILVAIAMIAVELVTLGNLVSIWFALGALGAMLVTFVTDSVLIQSLVFALVSLISLYLVRPIVEKTLRGNMIPTNADSIIGRQFKLSDEIADDSWGMINVDGSVWSCVSYDHKPIAINTAVEVVAIAGVKLVVKKIEGEN